MKGKKGQAAVEYLLTYGWAILLLVVVIGAIFASGVLTPSYFISEECYLGPNLPCAFQIYSDQATAKTYVVLNVTNGFPYTIKMTKFELSQSDSSDKVQPKEAITDSLASGNSLLLTFEMDNKVYSNGEMKKIGTTIEYVSCAKEINEPCEDKPELEHTISGRVIGRIVAINTGH